MDDSWPHTPCILCWQRVFFPGWSVRERIRLSRFIGICKYVCYARPRPIYRFLSSPIGFCKQLSLITTSHLSVTCFGSWMIRDRICLAFCLHKTRCCYSSPSWLINSPAIKCGGCAQSTKQPSYKTWEALAIQEIVGGWQINNCEQYKRWAVRISHVL